ncbi:MAG: hypothetical protein AAGA53_09860 [Pseudomonadota bacterium]
MDRRSFIKSIGAASLLPVLPFPSATIPAATAAPVVSTHTYKWAEMIVRAHNKCNLSMLQRLLQIDTTAATALKNQLLANGVISTHANAYGMHTAIKPLYEGAFMSVADTPAKTIETASELVEKLIDSETTENETSPDIKALDDLHESVSEEVKPDETVIGNEETDAENDKPQA